jgi:hypothetical protein
MLSKCAAALTLPCGPHQPCTTAGANLVVGLLFSALLLSLGLVHDMPGFRSDREPSKRIRAYSRGRTAPIWGGTAGRWARQRRFVWLLTPPWYALSCIPAAHVPGSLGLKWPSVHTFYVGVVFIWTVTTPALLSHAVCCLVPLMHPNTG